MGSDNASRDLQERLWEQIRTHVHLLLLWGYQKAFKLGLISSDMEEEIISTNIGDCIQSILDDPFCEEWCNNYSLFPEHPISDLQHKGKKRKPLDFVVEVHFRTVKGRPKYVIEAKNLNSSKSYQNGDNYVEDGVLRFLLREPYKNYIKFAPEMLMMGYVINEDLQTWQLSIKNKIQSHPSINLLSPFSDIEIIQNFEYEWISEHYRDADTKPLKIYHILLKCC